MKSQKIQCHRKITQRYAEMWHDSFPIFTARRNTIFAFLLFPPQIPFSISRSAFLDSMHTSRSRRAAWEPYLGLHGGEVHLSHSQVEAPHADVLLKLVGLVVRWRLQAPAGGRESVNSWIADGTKKWKVKGEISRNMEEVFITNP